MFSACFVAVFVVCSKVLFSNDLPYVGAGRLGSLENWESKDSLPLWMA